MTATYEQARDDIAAQVRPALVGVPTQWPDVAPVGVWPPASGRWAQVVIKHAVGFQTTLSGDAGQRRFARTGVLTVKLCAPKGDGLSACYQLAKLVGDVLEGQATPRQVWFRDVQVNELDTKGNFSQVNVTATFTYDEIK